MAETTARKTAKTTASSTPGDNPGETLQHPSLAHALAAFQAEMPTVHKGKTARIPGRDGRAGYSYDYADLADVAKVAHPLLARHGLSFNTAPQHVEGVGFVLQGTLRHTSGQETTGILPITGRSAQDLGSSLTYLRRYLLGCMTGIVTDEDEDGAIAETAGNDRPQAQTPPAVQPPAEAAHVTRLRNRLRVLNAEQTETVRSWWSQEGLPELAQVDEWQAAAVHSFMDEKGLAPANPQ